MKNFTSFLFLFILPFLALGQNYNLTGIVTQDGVPAPNTTVYLTQIDSLTPEFFIQELETVTDENGFYSFDISPNPESSLTACHVRSELCADQVWHVFFEWYENVFSKIKDLECDANWHPEMVIHSNAEDVLTKTWNFSATVYSLDVASYAWEIEGQIYNTPYVQHSFATAGLKDVLLTIESENGNTYTSMTTIDVADVTGQSITISGIVSQNEVGVAGAEVIFSAMSPFFGESYLETTTDATGYYEFTNTLYTSLIWEGDTTLFSLTTNACNGISAVNAPFNGSNMSFETNLNCDLDYAAIHIAAAPTDEPEMEWYFAAYTLVPMTSHTWYINGETISGNSTTYTFPTAGSYEITVTAQSSAGNLYTSSRTIEVGSPSISNCFAFFIHDIESSTTGQSYFINASLGTNLSYLWDFGDGNTSTEPYPIHSFADSDTTYTVCLTITGDGGCEDSYCTTVYGGGDGSGLVANGSKELHHLAKSGGFDFIVVPVLSANVGMREVGTLNFKVYPNPASDMVYLTANGSEIKDGYIFIMDVSGRVVEKTKVSGSGLISISVNEFSAGVYFMQYRGDGVSEVLKVVVE